MTPTELTLDSAEKFYRPDGQDSPYLSDGDVPRRLAFLLREEEQRRRGDTETIIVSPFSCKNPQNCSAEFDLEWEERKTEFPSSSPLLRCSSSAFGSVLRMVRELPPTEFEAGLVAVALRPIRQQRIGVLTDEVCETFYDYDRGRWAANLTRPDHFTIRTALAATLAALPAQEITSYWEKLQFGTPLMRRALWMGLEFLRDAHAASSLMFGLTYCMDHAVQAAIVDHLEQIGDACALPLLHRLRRETATTDWTLSRHLARAISAIERQNAGQNARTLLRPTTEVPEDESSLLRPLTEEARAALERQTLLRSHPTPNS
jgi:hypothetical protein